MNGLLFLVALRDFVRSEAKIVAVVRKTFGTTIKLHLNELSFSEQILNFGVVIHKRYVESNA